MTASVWRKRGGNALVVEVFWYPRLPSALIAFTRLNEPTPSYPRVRDLYDVWFNKMPDFGSLFTLDEEG